MLRFETDRGRDLCYYSVRCEGERSPFRLGISQIIQELQRRNVSTVIISGDHEKPTQKLAQELGIDHYFAETLPQDKARLIEQRKASGKSVCFTAWPSGCRFHPRCKFATEQCSQEGNLALNSVGEGHLSRCIRINEIELHVVRLPTHRR